MSRNTSYQRKKLAFGKGMASTTLDPEGPDVARLHLIPPKPSYFADPPHVLMVNGWHIVPVESPMAWLLRSFMEELPNYAQNGEEISQKQVEAVENAVINKMMRVYPETRPHVLRNDLHILLNDVTGISPGRTQLKTTLSLRDYAKKWMSAPHRMDLVISPMILRGKWHCPLHCNKICYAKDTLMMAVNTELSTDQWKRIIDICIGNMIPQITFTGGEPTMRADLPELVDHAKITITRLNTSGVTMTIGLAKKLRQASLDGCQMTLYSWDPEIHDDLVGVSGSWQKTVKGIENGLVAGLQLSVNTPLLKKNMTYTKTLELLYSLGVRQVSTSGLIPAGAAPNTIENGEALINEQLYRIMVEAVGFCSEHGMDLIFTSPGWLTQEQLKCLGLNYPVCGACLSNMAVSPTGVVVPCQSWLQDPNGLGNILTTPWSQIWEHPTAKKFRNQSRENCPLEKK